MFFFIVLAQDSTEEDIKARIEQARVAFLMLSKIWKSKLIKLKTKKKIFNSSVKSVLDI